MKDGMVQGRTPWKTGGARQDANLRRVNRSIRKERPRPSALLFAQFPFALLFVQFPFGLLFAWFPFASLFAQRFSDASFNPKQ